MTLKNESKLIQIGDSFENSDFISHEYWFKKITDIETHITSFHDPISLEKGNGSPKS